MRQPAMSCIRPRSVVLRFSLPTTESSVFCRPAGGESGNSEYSAVITSPKASLKLSRYASYMATSSGDGRSALRRRLPRRLRLDRVNSLAIRSAYPAAEDDV